MEEDEMKIHFAWIDWGLKQHRKIRKNVKECSDEEKIQIANNLSLNNQFLIRRNIDICFRNLIYHLILKDKSLYKKIIREIFGILTDRVMDKDEIELALTKEFLKADVINITDFFPETLIKAERTNKDALKYLSKKANRYKIQGNYERLLSVLSYLKEYTSGQFVVDSYFSEIDVPSIPKISMKYEKISRSFLISNVNKYWLYYGINKNIQNPLNKIKNLFGKPIINKLANFLYNQLGVEKDFKINQQYQVLFDHLLSISSIIYFKSLKSKEKIKLLNKVVGTNKLVDLIIHSGINWTHYEWIVVADILMKIGFYKDALNLILHFKKEQFEDLGENDKIMVLNTLASLYHGIEDYEESLLCLQEAFNLLEKSTSKFAIQNPKISYLIKIGECNGHLGNEKERKMYFNKAISLIKNIKNPQDKCLLYVQLSQSYSLINDFINERKYLDHGINFLDGSEQMELEVYINSRIENFLETEMDHEKLKEINLIEKISMYIKNGQLARICFNIEKSIEIFDKALEISKKIKDKEIKALITKNLAISYMYIRQWNKVKQFFEQELSLKEDFESKLYLFMAVYLEDQVEAAIEIFIEIIKAFVEDPKKFHDYFDFWMLKMINHFGPEKLKGLLNELEKIDFEKKFDFFYFTGIRLGDFGFSSLAIELFKNEIKNSKDFLKKAKCHNSIGTIYHLIDELDLAQEHFEKAIELNEEYYMAYKNLAETYIRKLDVVNAVKNLEIAIKLGMEQNKGNFEIHSTQNGLESMKKMMENVININKIRSDKARDVLIDAERLFFEITKKKEFSEGANVIINYGRALEIMLHEDVSQIFNPLIQKYKNKNFSIDFKKKFLPLFKGKSISLGSWGRIIKDFKTHINDQALQEFRKMLYNSFQIEELDIIKEASDFIGGERNPVAHIEILSIVEMLGLRNKCIVILNKVIDIIY